MVTTALHSWDYVLLTVVTVQTAIHAYVPHAQHKAFIYLLPFPFTAAALAIGRPIDAANIWSLLLMLSYTHLVRLLHINLRVNIFAAIALALCWCAALGFTLAHMLDLLQHHYSPTVVFWVSGTVILLLGLLIQSLMPAREEVAHRTPAPLWIKVPTIAAVILFLIVLKKELGGFITAFPMVGVVAAYEARRSLWTMSRQTSLLLPALVAMMVAAHLAQAVLGWPLPMALAVGWIIYLPIIIACTPILRRRLSDSRKGAITETLSPAD